MDYFRLEDKTKELRVFAHEGLGELKSTGIASLDPYYKIKKGYPLFIAGNPGAGKTEFAFEMLINLSVMYNWKHFVYCGEGGNVEHIFNELVHKYLEKPYKYATEKEKITAEYFVNEHFIIANHDKEFSIDEFYDLAKKIEAELGIVFDTTTFDPFNDIRDDLSNFNGREDKYLAHALKVCRNSSKMNNRLDILINHVADVPPKNDQKTGKSYLPPALPTQWAGGRTWWRRAFTMLLIYKPYTWIEDENGRLPEENEGHVIIQKSKPKGVGKKGTAKIFWDYKKNRYYSYNQSNQLLYSCQEPAKSELLPSEEFFNNNEEAPF